MLNLRTDPYERADITWNTYCDWLLDCSFFAVPAQDYVGQFLLTFRDYPRRLQHGSISPPLAKLKGSSGSK